MKTLAEEKKALELRAENLTGELDKARTQAADGDASRHQLQVCAR